MIETGRRFRTAMLGVFAAVCLAAAAPAPAAQRALWLRYPAISPDGRTDRLQLRRQPVRGAGRRRRRAGAHGQRPPQFHAGVVAGREIYRLRRGHLRQLRRLPHLLRRRAGAPPDVQLDPETRPLHAGRQGRRLLGHRTGRRAPMSASRRRPSPSSTRCASRRAAARCRCSPRRRSPPATTRPATGSLYEDLKGYENLWRKHHNCRPFARDIWLYDVKSGKHTAHAFPGRRTATGLGARGRRAVLPLASAAARSTCGGSTLADPPSTRRRSDFERGRRCAF